MPRAPIALVLALATGTSAASDPVRDCRDAHGDDAPARIACLEDALRRQGDVPTNGLGVEQMQQRERAKATEPEEVTVQIVAASYNAAGLGTFRTSDGQVWRETEVAPGHLRLAASQKYVARIKRTSFGGYRMFVDGRKWMRKVERIE